MKSVECSADGMDNYKNKTLLQDRREMERIAGTHEHPAMAGTPDVVGVTVVGVEPEAVLVAFDVEHVEVTVRVRDV